MEIRQGEQYSIPVKITSSNSVVVKPADVEDVRIKINGILKSYDEGELTFDTTENVWKFPVTEEQTIEYGRYITVEASVLYANNIIVKSPVLSVQVTETTITEMWTE